MARNALGPTVGATASPQSAHTFPVIRVDEAPKIRPQIKPKPKPIDGPIIRLETSNEPRLNGSIGQPRKPLPPTRTPRANGNAVMKEQRTTVVSFDFAEDPIPPGSYGCGRVETICRLVGILSFLAFAANSALYFMGVSRLGLNGYLEVLLLFCDGVAVLAILIGVSKRKSGLLKPYLIFNTLWILGLFILFVVCLWKIIRGSDGVARSILENLRALKPSDEVFSRSESFQGSRTAATVATLVVMSAMAFVIFVDCLFLHIVYRTFQFFAYLEDQRREENNKKDPL